VTVGGGRWSAFRAAAIAPNNRSAATPLAPVGQRHRDPLDRLDHPLRRPDRGEVAERRRVVPEGLVGPPSRAGKVPPVVGDDPEHEAIAQPEVERFALGKQPPCFVVAPRQPVGDPERAGDRCDPPRIAELPPDRQRFAVEAGRGREVAPLASDHPQVAEGGANAPPVVPLPRQTERPFAGLSRLAELPPVDRDQRQFVERLDLGGGVPQLAVESEAPPEVGVGRLVVAEVDREPTQAALGHGAVGRVAPVCRRQRPLEPGPALVRVAAGPPELPEVRRQPEGVGTVAPLQGAAEGGP
jgi:hypothetical protein